MLNTDLGFRSENIIKVPFLQSFLYSPDMDWRARFEKNEQIMQIVKQRMDASPLFDNWALGRGTPNELANSTLEFRAPGGELQKTTLMRADNEWFNVFDIKLIAGRNFIKEIDDLSYNLIVSESVLKQFGIDNYEDALLESSRRIWFAGGIGRDTEMATNPPFRIVGVVKDFCPVHLSQQQYSLTFYFMDGSSNPAHPILASLNPSNRQQVIEFMRNLHEELVGGEFTYSFIEDEMATIYKEDRKIAVIYSIFTLIAIFISALGLFALSLFDIQQRRKEIAIRKVNGANTNDIIILLLKRYAILLSIAFLISVPISLFAIHRYLESFAYKAVISWWLFAVALAITGIVSLLTLIYQTYKASNENPAEVVKGK
jgi:hypothetical protein